MKGFLKAGTISKTISMSCILLLASPLAAGLQTNQSSSKKAAASSQPRTRKKKPLRKPDVIYYPTPPETVAEMLRLATIKQGDVLYDLGSGDGRIPIAAAKQFGIKAVGIEIDPKLVAEAQTEAQEAGVSHLVQFRNEDMFRINVSEATVVTLYLSDKLNVLLRPKLLSELRPGSRILSHDFRMGDWKPEQTVRVPWGKLYRTIYVWTVPHRRRIRAGASPPSRPRVTRVEGDSQLRMTFKVKAIEQVRESQGQEGGLAPALNLPLRSHPRSFAGSSQTTSSQTQTAAERSR